MLAGTTAWEELKRTVRYFGSIVHFSSFLVINSSNVQISKSHISHHHHSISQRH